MLTGRSRKGDNLYTCSIVALNVDTGKLAWYFQPSPHDTHDWDATQTPVLIDDEIDGKPRKLLAQANRNGYFFLLDRTNGKSVLTAPMIHSMNWSKRVAPNGQPIPDPAKEASVDGVLVSPQTGGATNWPPPSFDPQTGLFYVGTEQNYSMFYLPTLIHTLKDGARPRAPPGTLVVTWRPSISKPVKSSGITTILSLAEPWVF